MVSSEEVNKHIGHKIESTTWDEEIIYLKCKDCNKVLIDYNHPHIDGATFKANYVSSQGND